MQKRTERNEEIINKEAQLTLYIFIYRSKNPNRIKM